MELLQFRMIIRYVQFETKLCFDCHRNILIGIKTSLCKSFTILKKYQSNESYPIGMESESKDQIDEHNVALEDLIKSKEAKTGSFSNKLKFWQKSNDAKFSMASEKYEV